MKKNNLYILGVLLLAAFSGKSQAPKEGNLAISVDKMNVLYYGIDNPISISSPAGQTLSKVEVAGADMTGDGFKRILRPSSPVGKTTVTVTRDNGLVNTFEFRNSQIPAPRFKVGSGASRMRAVEFRKQKNCRVELPNCYLDLKYKVLSASVFFQGTGFKVTEMYNLTGNSLAGISSLMKKCGPGSTIAFTNIKVSGPDGVRALDDVTILLY